MYIYSLYLKKVSFFFFNKTKPSLHYSYVQLNNKKKYDAHEFQVILNREDGWVMKLLENRVYKELENTFPATFYFFNMQLNFLQSTIGIYIDSTCALLFGFSPTSNQKFWWGEWPRLRKEIMGVFSRIS